MDVSTVLCLMVVSLHMSASKGTYCGANGLFYRDECLYVSSDVTKWIDADTACELDNTNHRLVTITDQAMNDFLIEHIESDVWIGLHDTHEEGNWRWLDDTLVNYTNFAPSVPARSDTGSSRDVTAPETANCVALLHGSGVWQDEDCTQWKRRICAFPRGEPECSDGGIFFRDRCYWYGDTGRFRQAERYCETEFGEGVKPVIVRDAELNAFLSRYVHSDQFLGLQYQPYEGIWRWVDGSPLVNDSFQEWRDGGSANVVGERYCAVLNYNDKKWTTQSCSSFTRFVCAMQTCYDDEDADEGASGMGAGGNCQDFGSDIQCTCVSNALCRRTGQCRCEKLFDGMKCDKDELKVKIHAPKRLDQGSNVTMRCHVNLPSTDVTVLWQKVSGSEMLLGDRIRRQNLPERGDYILTIHNVQEDDEGSYVCVASVILGEVADIRMDNTFLHVAVPDGEKPQTKIGEVSNEINNIPVQEKGLIVAVAALAVCMVGLIVAFVVKMRLSKIHQRSRRPSDMMM